MKPSTFIDGEKASGLFGVSRRHFEREVDEGRIPLTIHRFGRGGRKARRKYLRVEAEAAARQYLK